jgi:hypothetical protein
MLISAIQLNVAGRDIQSKTREGGKMLDRQPR